MDSSGTPVHIPDYELLKPVGEGAYGTVWLGRNRLTGTIQAIKVIFRSADDQGKTSEREFSGIQKYEPISRSHPSLMPILHVGRDEDAGFFYYVMEAADNVCLDSPLGPNAPFIYTPRTLWHQLHTKGRLSARECIELGIALTSALQVLHARKLLHRDIKPSNIIYANGRPKLADIGLVEHSDATVSLVGTVGYAAPEGPASARSDLYSLGKVLYVASTGRDRRQFPEPLTETLTTEEAILWAELNEVILTACQAAPARRHSSAAALKKDLELLLAGKSLRRIKSRKRSLQIGLAVAAVMSLVSGSLLWRQRSHWENQRAAAQLAQEKAAIHQFRRHISEAQTIRLTPHWPGWSRRAQMQIAQALNLANAEGITELQAEAVALLKGIDVERVFQWKELAGNSLSFVPEQSSVAAAGPAGLKLIDLPSGHLQDFSKEALTGAAFANGHIISLSTGDRNPAVNLFPLDHSPPFSASTLSQMRTIEKISFSRMPFAFVVSGIATNSSPEVRIYSGITNWALSAIPTGLELSEDASFLALSHGEKVDLWSTSDRKILNTLAVEPLHVTSLAFVRATLADENGRQKWLLAVGDSGGAVRLWDPLANSVRNYYRGSHFGVTALAGSRDGTILVSAGRGDARVWDVANSSLLIRLSGEDQVNSIALHSALKYIAIASETFSSATGGLSIWQVEGDRGISTLRGLRGQISKICFSPDNRLLAALSHHWEVGVWDLEHKQLLFTFAVPPGNSADNASLNFDLTGSHIACASGTHAVLWNLQSKARKQHWNLPDGLVDSLAFNRDGQIVLCRYEQKQLVLRNLTLQGEKPLATIDAFLRGRHYGADLSPDAAIWTGEGSETLSDGSPKRSVKAYRIPSGEKLWEIPIPETLPFGTPIIDPSGTFVCVQIKASTKYRILDLLTGTPAFEIPTAPTALSPRAESYLLHGGPEKPVFTLFRANTHRVFTVPTDDYIYSVNARFNFDATAFAWGNPDGTIAVCRLPEIDPVIKQLNL